MQLERFHGWPPLASLVACCLLLVACCLLLVACCLLLVAKPSVANKNWQAVSALGRSMHLITWAVTITKPRLSLSYGDRFYFSLRDGLGWNAVCQGNWRVSPFIGYTPGRDDDDDLYRLDEVDGGSDPANSQLERPSARVGSDFTPSYCRWTQRHYSSATPETMAEIP
jgi:hypothetical protein